MNPNHKPFVAALSGAAIVLLGLAVLVGAWLDPLILKRLVWGARGMGLNTAICFVMVGLALLSEGQRPAIRLRIQTALGGAIMLIAAIVLLQTIMGWTASGPWRLIMNGIGQESGLLWQWPGNMTLYTAAAFLAGGFVIVALDRLHQAWGTLIVLVLIVAIAALGMMGFVAYMLQLSLFRMPAPFVGIMSAPTSMGFLVLAFGLFGAASGRAFIQRYYAGREDRRIILPTFVGFGLLLVLSGTVATGVMLRQNMGIFEQAQQDSLATNALLMQREIQVAVKRIEDAAWLSELDQVLLTDNRNAAADKMERITQALDAQTVAGLSLRNLNGQVLIAQGNVGQIAEMSAPLRITGARLEWDQGWLLAVTLPIRRGAGEAGELFVRLRLPTLEEQFRTGTGRSGEVVVCADKGAAMLCFPSRLGPGNARLPRMSNGISLPMHFALNGESGVTIRTDYRNQEVVAAYQPLQELGLGMVLKIDTQELHAPIRTDYWQATLVFAFFAAAGTVALYLWLRPIVRRLAHAESSMRAVLDNVPAAVATIDEQGIVQSINAEGVRMFGYSREELVGHPLGTLMLEPDRSNHNRHLSRYLASRESNVLGKGPRELTGLHKEGRPISLDVAIGEYRVGSAQRFVGIMLDISERKAAEQSLRRSEELLSRVLDTLPVGVWIADANGNLIRGNPTGKRIWEGAAWVGIDGYQEYKGWWAETGKRIEAEEWALARAIQKGETSINEIVDIQCFDGSRKTILNSAVPLRGAQGEIAGAIVVNQDITEARHAELELRRSESALANAQRVAHLGDWEWDVETGSLYWSDEIYRIFGLDPGQVTPTFERFIDQVLAEDRAPVQDAIDRAMRGEAPYDITHRIIRPDGTIRHVHETGEVLCDTKGRALRMTGVVQDVTEQWIAADELREREATFSAIAENLPGMVFQLRKSMDHPAGMLSYVSTGVLDVLGVADETLNQDFTILQDMIHTEDLPGFRKSLERSERNLQSWNWEGRVQTAHGEEKWVNLRAMPRDAKGDGVVWDGIIFNITEHKQNQLQLERSRIRLRELSAHDASIREQERKHIAREVHDELGQLLTALKMDTTLLEIELQGASGPPQARLHAMRTLINQTLRVVRQVTTSLRPLALDLGLVSAMEWLANDVTQRTGIRCHLNLTHDDIHLSDAQATGVFRILQESLTNVVRHAEANRVDISLEHANGLLSLEVRDNGIGFEPAALTGTTFGLLGMQERAAMLGGELAVSSHPGTGTSVRLTMVAP